MDNFIPGPVSVYSYRLQINKYDLKGRKEVIESRGMCQYGENRRSLGCLWTAGDPTWSAFCTDTSGTSDAVFLCRASGLISVQRKAGASTHKPD